MKEKRQRTVTYIHDSIRDSKHFTEVNFTTCPNILNLDQPILTNSTHFHVEGIPEIFFMTPASVTSLLVIAESNTVENAQATNNCTRDSA